MNNLEHILNSISHGIALIDDRYEVLYANPAMSCLGNVMDSSGESLCYRAFENREDACPDCPATETFSTGRVAHVVRHCKQKDGNTRIMKISSFPFKKGDMVTQCVISARDITEIYRMEKQKEDLLHMLAHDIRNPILATTQSLDNLIRGNYGILKVAQDRILTTTRDTCDLLLAMIDDLLDIYRHEAGKFLISRNEFSIDHVIQTAVGLVHTLAEDNDVLIEVRMDQYIPALMGDERRLIRTVINLLENAIKFSPMKEWVQIEVTGMGNLLQVSVTNLGDSIAPECRERIFEKYFQAERSDCGGKAGMGLGLPFCRMIIEAHGGEIRAESPLAGMDHGSCFMFTLPIEK